MRHKFSVIHRLAAILSAGERTRHRRVPYSTEQSRPLSCSRTLPRQVAFPLRSESLAGEEPEGPSPVLPPRAQPLPGW